MKLSTRIKKYVNPKLLWEFSDSVTGDDTIDREIVLIVDAKSTFNGKEYKTFSLSEADEMNDELLKSGCKLLPVSECPVVSHTDIVMHYTSTTYSDWYNL